MDGVIVHVVAFAPREGLASVGGFDWYHAADIADRKYRAARGDEQEQAVDSHDWYRFDARVSSLEDAEREIDALWRDWPTLPTQPQPVDVRQP
jgi:hypothetical protein